VHWQRLAEYLDSTFFPTAREERESAFRGKAKAKKPLREEKFRATWKKGSNPPQSAKDAEVAQRNQDAAGISGGG
jgi:hypothetical protein